jgi:16S rRNA (adenine1518-N6/adenine1519-N6)-dimethyltransferase
MPRLAQHFLKSKAVARLIVECANLQRRDSVMEIGPGKGVLTELLVAIVAKVVAIEKDPNLVLRLRERFALEIDSGKLELVEADVRETNFGDFDLASGDFHIVANIPYYITGIFIRSALSAEVQPKKMTLMLQKEVAQRIAKTKKESLLSLSVKAYGIPNYVKTVPAKLFKPVPDVDSAIITIDDISRKSFRKVSEKHFFDVLHAGFAHKRKKLAGNLATYADKGQIEKIFSDLSLGQNIRAEDVPISTWLKLAALI